MLFIPDRITVLAFSILFSLLSLIKTSVNVNRPDPDERRTSPQYNDHPTRFVLTSVVFHFFCVLFRLCSIAYFFATIREYTTIILFGTLIINVVLLYINSESNYVVIVLLGVVSVFGPNGYLVSISKKSICFYALQCLKSMNGEVYFKCQLSYLFQLHNFAAIFPVDFTFQQTKRFLWFHMALVTSLFLGCVVVIMASVGRADWLDDNIPNDSILNDEKIQYGLTSCLLFLGVMSIVSCFYHWKRSIVPLYDFEEDQEQPEETEAL